MAEPLTNRRKILAISTDDRRCVFVRGDLPSASAVVFLGSMSVSPGVTVFPGYPASCLKKLHVRSLSDSLARLRAVYMFVASSV